MVLHDMYMWHTSKIYKPQDVVYNQLYVFLPWAYLGLTKTNSLASIDLDGWGGATPPRQPCLHSTCAFDTALFIQDLIRILWRFWSSNPDGTMASILEKCSFQTIDVLVKDHPGHTSTLHCHTNKFNWQIWQIIIPIYSHSSLPSLFGRSFRHEQCFLGQLSWSALWRQS